VRNDAALRTFFLWLLEPEEAAQQLEREREHSAAMLAEFRRISEEPTGANRKARTFRIALEGGIRHVESRLEWLDWAIEQVESPEWRSLD
jgi:hypothetical protein